MAVVTKLSAGFFHFLHPADTQEPSCGANDATLFLQIFNKGGVTKEESK